MANSHIGIPTFDFRTARRLPVGLSPRVTEWRKVMMGNRYIAHGQEGRKDGTKEGEKEGLLEEGGGSETWPKEVSFGFGSPTD